MGRYGQDYKINFQLLTAENKHCLKYFSCGNRTIDAYLRTKSYNDKTSVTYLFLEEVTDRLIACVTIACSAIFTEAEEEQYSTLLSAMEVKYLATDETYQHIPYSPDMPNVSLSDVIFDYVISYMEELSLTKIGAAKIVLYAVPTAVNFYKRHGFKKFGDTMYGDEGYFVDDCEPMFLDLNT